MTSELMLWGIWYSLVRKCGEREEIGILGFRFFQLFGLGENKTLSLIEFRTAIGFIEVNNGNRMEQLYNFVY